MCEANRRCPPPSRLGRCHAERPPTRRPASRSDGSPPAGRRGRSGNRRSWSTLGAIAGLLGLTVLQFRCLYQNAGHLLVWHGGVLVLSIATGLLVALAVERKQRAAIEMRERRCK